MLNILSLAPIASLIIMSLIKGVKSGVLISSLITIIIYFYWGGGTLGISSSVINSSVAMINIGMIIFGAVFLYKIMDGSSLIRRISESVNIFNVNKSIKFFLISFGLTSFFEGVAGFGIPGAIVPLILISLGYGPILSVSSVLIMNTIAVAFGAAGTPIYAGLSSPLGLSIAKSSELSLLTGGLIFFSGVLAIFFAMKLYTKLHNEIIPSSSWRKIWLMYLVFSLSFVNLSFYMQESASIVASLVMMIFAFFFFEKKKGFSFDLKAWSPYVLLATLLLIPRFIPPLWDIMNTDIGFSFKPLRNPLLAFAITSIFLILHMKVNKELVKRSAIDSLGRMSSIAPIIFLSVFISQLMLNSGGSNPSMTDFIARSLALSNLGFENLSVFIGVIGAFISGGNTISNVVFGPSVLQASDMLSKNSSVSLALLSSGGAIGNAICLFNIVAACSIAGIKDQRSILKINAIPVLCCAVVVGLIGVILSMIF